MNKKILSFLVCLILLLVVFPAPVLADIGPKPSVVVNFDGVEGRNYYVTLLSRDPSTGPYSVLEPGRDEDYHEGYPDYSVYRKFVEYQDTDGYYFLQYFDDCSETHQFTWGYYPPADFKILIYFADTDSFAVSAEPYERYAFDSYFNVQMEGSDIFSVVAPDGVASFRATKSYDYKGQIFSLVARVVLTIVVELLIALLFAFRKKRQILFIICVNVVTQVALNVALNAITYRQGPLVPVATYIVLELCVFAVEAVLYAVCLQKFSGEPVPKGKAVAYALVANAVSFVMGLGLAHIVPGIF